MSDIYRTYLRYKMLQEMSDEDKRMLALLSEKDSHLIEIKQQLDAIQRQAEANKYSFTTDVLANITGNVITDGAALLLSCLFKRIRP